MKKNIAKEYNSTFYAQMKSQTLKDTNLTSAQEMVPYILKLFPRTKSLVDVGCGIGAWAYTFKKCGVSSVLGLDGSWVDRKQLLLKKDEFEIFNLESAKKYLPSKKFDMAICLEVAEHLDAKYAENLVDTLTALSNVVVFSAAIPNQGGVHHVNEQFQSYWKEKFEKRDYIGLDLLRGQFASNEKVSVWYAQNVLVYIKAGTDYPEIKNYYNIPYVVDFISPNMLPYINASNTRPSNTWKHLFGMQRKLISAYVRKILMALKMR